MTGDNGDDWAAVRAIWPARQRLSDLELTRRARDEDGIPVLARSTGVNRFPASISQEHLFRLHELDPSSSAYIPPMALRLRGDLRQDLLDEALAALVARHEVLRSGLELDAEHQLMQVVAPAEAISVRLDIESADGSDVPGRTQHMLCETMNFGDPSLFRVRLWRIEGSEPKPEWVLVLCIPHIVAGGWSFRILADELARMCNLGAAGRPAALADRPVQFADFATWQNGRLSSSAFAAHLRYWQNALADSTGLALTSDRRKRAEDSFRGGAIPCLVPSKLVDALTRVGQQGGTTLHMVLLTAFALALDAWSEHESDRHDIVIGAPVAGRSRAELEHVVGCFANLVPVWVRPYDAVTFRDLLRQVRSTCMAGRAHEDVPLELIVPEIGGTRRSSLSAPFNVTLSLSDMLLGPMRLHSLETEFLDLLPEDANFDLTLALAPSDDGGLSGWPIHSLDLFDPSAADHLRTNIQRIPTAIAAEHDARLAHFTDLVSPGWTDREAVTPAAADTSGAADPLPKVLTMIWSETLGVEPIGPRDDFFDLGGHSLLATLIGSEIRDLFRVELPPRFFIDAPTVAALTDLVRAQGARQNVDVDQVAEIVLALRHGSAST
jgi:acyl carrier protein